MQCEWNHCERLMVGVGGAGGRPGFSERERVRGQ
jgi:hypothetical protein